MDVVSAQEMYEAVERALPSAGAAILSAAVADYRPAQPSAQKIKKSAPTLTLTLERTSDILGSVRTKFGWRGFLTGFAAETEDVLRNAREKLTRKGCDLMIANDVSQPGIGFDAEENEVTLLYADGNVRTLPRMAKTELASLIIREVERAATRPALRS